MFAQPAALLFLVTKTLWDGKPLQRLFEFALVRRDDARQCWRHFRPQRDFAFAFVGKIEKLRDDFRAAFLSVKIGRLEDRAIPFDKPIAPRRFAPSRENVVSKRTISGKKSRKPGSGCISQITLRQSRSVDAAARDARREVWVRLNKFRLQAVG